MLYKRCHYTFDKKVGGDTVSLNMLKIVFDTRLYVVKMSVDVGYTQDRYRMKSVKYGYTIFSTGTQQHLNTVVREKVFSCRSHFIYIFLFFLHLVREYLVCGVYMMLSV